MFDVLFTLSGGESLKIHRACEETAEQSATGVSWIAPKIFGGRHMNTEIILYVYIADAIRIIFQGFLKTFTIGRFEFDIQ